MMIAKIRIVWASLVVLATATVAAGQTGIPPRPSPGATPGPTSRFIMQPPGTYKLADVRMRDVCIRPDPATKTYYMVGPARRGVRMYTSRDLRTWDGPQVIYRPPDDVWGDVQVWGIWAPEMHIYNGKYYLF